MSVIYFIIILSVLAVVHELGHFLVAKYFNIRVDEFGLGYPPKAASLFSWKGTLFSLNWLPFGGFVRIFGENPLEDEESRRDPRAFSSKNRGIQAFVLVAGVTANFLFAWFLIALGFTIGLPAPEGMNLPISNSHTVITTVLKDSPAEQAGLKSGDILVSLSRDNEYASLAPDIASAFIGGSSTPVTFVVQRGGEILTKTVTPSLGVVEDKQAVGVGLDIVGTVKLSPLRSLYEGFKVTVRLTVVTAEALGSFLLDAVRGKADLRDITGPVGLVGAVGDVRALGFVYILSFTALISLNLTIVNLLPIPALDGGRLLFVIIESIIRRPVPTRIFVWANTGGFILLLILMVVITFRDIMHLI